MKRRGSIVAATAVLCDHFDSNSSKGLDRVATGTCAIVCVIPCASIASRRRDGAQFGRAQAAPGGVECCKYRFRATVGGAVSADIDFPLHTDLSLPLSLLLCVRVCV